MSRLVKRVKAARGDNPGKLFSRSSHAMYEVENDLGKTLDWKQRQGGNGGVVMTYHAEDGDNEYIIEVLKQ